MIRALDEMEREPYDKYNHLVLIVGNAHNHEDYDEDCSYTKNATYNKSFAGVWDDIYCRIRRFESIRVMFMPVSGNLLLRTAKIMERGLGSEIVDSASASTETDFVDIVTKTTVREYKRFIGIS